MIKYGLIISLFIGSPLFAMEQKSKKKRIYEASNKSSSILSEKDQKNLELLRYDTAFKVLYRAEDAKRKNCNGQEKDIVNKLIQKRDRRRIIESSAGFMFLQSEREKLGKEESECLVLYQQLDDVLPADDEVKEARIIGEKLTEFVQEAMKYGVSFETTKYTFLRTDND